MCGTVNSHNIGPGWQAFHRSNKVLHHGIFAVGILRIGVTHQIETPSLNDTGIGALIFLAGQLSRGPQVCLVACAGGIILVPDIGPNKNRFRTVRFDAAVEIQNQLIIGERAFPVFKNFQQNGIVFCLHPQVKVLGSIVCLLNKEIAHPTGVAVPPQFQLFLQQMFIGVVFTVQINFTDFFGAGHGGFIRRLRLPGLAAAGGQHQQHHYQQGGRHMIQFVIFHLYSPYCIHRSRLAFQFCSAA